MSGMGNDVRTIRVLLTLAVGIGGILLTAWSLGAFN
jgi:hypothetical protein